MKLLCVFFSWQSHFRLHFNSCLNVPCGPNPFGALVHSVVWSMGNILKPMRDCSNGMKSPQTHGEYNELSVNTRVPPTPNKKKEIRLEVWCSKIFHGNFMYILYADMISAQSVDCGFKAWLKHSITVIRANSHKTKSWNLIAAVVRKRSKWHQTHTLTYAHSLSRRMGQI